MRLNGTTKLTFAGIAAAALVAGATVQAGFQGFLAGMGILSLAGMAVVMIFAVKKARLYGRAVRYAEAVEKAAAEGTDITTTHGTMTRGDAKWITGHIDELFSAGKDEQTREETITSGDKKDIMQSLDTFITVDGPEVLSSDDKEQIMANVHILFEES